MFIAHTILYKHAQVHPPVQLEPRVFFAAANFIHRGGPKTGSQATAMAVGGEWQCQPIGLLKMAPIYQFQRVTTTSGPTIVVVIYGQIYGLVSQHQHSLHHSRFCCCRALAIPGRPKWIRTRVSKHMKCAWTAWHPPRSSNVRCQGL